MTKKISSMDIAKEAGVSRTTVSYVLNNVEDIKIKPETREKVLAAAKKLGYYGNSIARSMKTGKVMSIGVVSQWNVTHQRFTEVLNGIKSIAANNHYSITLCSYDFDEHNIPEYLNYYFGKKIDGIIFLSSNKALNNSIIDIVKEKGIPAVFADCNIIDSELNCINIDYYQGAYSAAEYLIQKGHKKFISILHDTNTIQENSRLDGIKSALKNYNIPLYNFKSITLSKQDDYNFEIINKTLVEKGDYAAVITSWRATAFKTLYYANKLNIKIPEELSLISLDGSEFADYSYPSLSTSDLPLYKIGEKSAEALISSINGRLTPINEVLTCSLHLRESTET